MVKYTDLISDTICSQITAPGYAGVSVLRISGNKALERTRRLCPDLSSKIESHRTYLVGINDVESKKHIDTVLLTYFEDGRSFTGDEVVEISCHGNPLVVNTIIAQFMLQDCRLAERGEFSFRAFYNGKIDLVQAESINQFIHTTNQTSAGFAFDQLNGGLSKVFVELEKNLLFILGQLEASIDFSEQDIQPEAYSGSSARAQELGQKIDELVASYDVGRNLSNRWNIVFAGETNAGKSSLFNAHFQQEIAIVSEFAGTTRDPVAKDSFLQNHSVLFVDSAGLRETDNSIEKLGIEKSLNHMEKAAILLWVFDSTKKIPFELLAVHENKNIILVANKLDLLTPDAIASLQSEVRHSGYGDELCLVSAKTGQGLDELKNRITFKLSSLNGADGSTVLTQARHFEHLCKMKDFVGNGQSLLLDGESPDLISQEFQMALLELNQLLGKSYDDEILDTIFREFCLGK